MVSKTPLCTMCSSELPPVWAGKYSERSITGDVCQSCLDQIGSRSGMPLGVFLDQLAVPVLLLDGDCVVQAANKTLERLLDKDFARISGLAAGLVFECAFAQLPEGCGRTVHCSGCAIRRTVMETFTTGQNQRDVTAYLNREYFTQTQKIQLSISTEKAWNMVLLKVELVESD